jgi:hypothetical protein
MQSSEFYLFVSKSLIDLHWVRALTIPMHLGLIHGFFVPPNKSLVEVSDTVHLFSMDERKTNLMHLLHICIVAVGDALHVSGVFAHRQER